MRPTPDGPGGAPRDGAPPSPPNPCVGEAPRPPGEAGPEKAARGDVFFTYRGAWIGAAGVPLVFLPSSWEPHPVPRVLAGAVLVAAGAALRLLAVRSLGKHARVHRLTAGVLHTSGVYAFTRNPIYVGALLMAAGIAVVLGLFPYLPVLLLYMGTIYHMIVLREERFLAQVFGDAFSRYTREVSRWFPWRLPRAGRTRVDHPVPWGEVLRRERGFLFGITLALGLCLVKNQWYDPALGALHGLLRESRTALVALLLGLFMVFLPLVTALRIAHNRARKAARRYRIALEQARASRDVVDERIV